MDYSRWLRSSPSHDRDPALGERPDDQKQDEQDISENVTSSNNHASTSSNPNARPKASLFDVPPGFRTIVSGGRQNARQTPLTQSHSSSLSSSGNGNGGMMLDGVDGQQQQHRGRLTRLQRKSMLKSDETSLLANEISDQHDKNDIAVDEQAQEQESSTRSMDYTFARPAPPTSAPASTSYFQQQQQQQHQNDSDIYTSQPQASTSYTVYQPSHGRSLSSAETSFDAGASQGASRFANPFAGQQAVQQHLHQQHLHQSQPAQDHQQRYSTQHSRSSSVSSVQGGPLSSGFTTSMFRPHSRSISSSASSSFNGEALANSMTGTASRDGATTPSTSSTRRVNRLTNLDRKELCEYAALHPRMKHDHLGQLFNVERSTVSKILKARTKWLGVKQDNTLSPPSTTPSTFPSNTPNTIQQSPKRNTHSSSSGSSPAAGTEGTAPAPPTPSTSTAAVPAKIKIGGRHPELEVLLGEWGRSETRQGNLLSDELVREQALKIAATLNIPVSAFKASVGWLENFKERMGYKSGEFDLDPKYEKLPDNHPELRNRRNEAHKKAIKERKDSQIQASSLSSSTASSASILSMKTMTISTTRGTEDMDESDSVSPCWTPSEASYRSAGSGWLSPVSLGGTSGGPPLRVNTRESLSLSSSAASLPGLVEEDDDDFSEEDLIRSRHSLARHNTNTSSGSSGLRSSSRSSLALHSITGLHSNSSSTNPSPTNYTHPQLYGGESSSGAAATMQHMSTPRQQRHHPYQQQQQQPDFHHTPLSPHHGSFPQHLNFGNNKSMQQASIAFNLNLNSTPLQTIEARTPLELHSPTAPTPDMRGSSTSPAEGQGESGVAASSGRSIYSLRSRMASAPQIQSQSQPQQQLSSSTRTRQATHPQHQQSAPGMQEQSNYMIPGFPTQPPGIPAKAPLLRAHTAPMIPQLDEHHFDHNMSGAVSPQSQPELYLSSDYYQQQYSSSSDYASQQMMQIDSDMTTVGHDGSSSHSHFSPHLQPFDHNTNATMHQQQLHSLEREQAILAVEGQLSYHSPNAYSPTSFGGNAPLPPGQLPQFLNPPTTASSASSINPAGGSYGTSLSPATATWSEKVTFNEAYMALRKVVGFLHDQQTPTYQQQNLQAGLAAPDQVATLEHLLGQFRAASASRYPHLTPPSST